MITLLGLFLGAFLAATILPFSSEAMLVAALNAGQINTWLLVFVATVGNVLGAVVNWWLGRYLLHWADRRWFPFSKKQLDRGSSWFNKYGAWSLLFSFLPVVGDPLTFAAGVLRVQFILFLVLVTLGKAARYILVGWAF